MKKKNLRYFRLFLFVALLFGVAIFFTYFQVKNVEVRGSVHYSDQEIQDMVLTGALSKNSILAPFFHNKDTGRMPFVEEIAVTTLDRQSIVISVHEKKLVGCFQYMGSYIYFDRNGVFVEGSRIRARKVPFFHGIEVAQVVEGEKIPMKGSDILSTSVTLSTIFEKNETNPDYVEYNDLGQILIIYGDITVNLGKNQYLEDKMARAFAILPMLSDKKGILHLESITDTVRTVTFEEEQGEEKIEES